MTPRVHGLIVNWNGRQHLEQCLPSLMCSYSPHHIWTVLDNGSTDGSQEWLKHHFPTITLYELKRNLGFATANNVGIRLALAERADYVVLLNNDTRVEPNWLDVLIEVAESDPNIAICQARQRTWNGSHEVRFRFVPEWAEAEQEHVPVAAPGPAAPTPFASGCAMLLTDGRPGRPGRRPVRRRRPHGSGRLAAGVDGAGLHPA